MDAAMWRECRDLVLDETRRALESIDPAEVAAFVQALDRAETIFFVGVGRVALSASAMVKRLNHLGLRAWMVGDLAEPAATAGDLLVVASGSGESAVPVAIARVAQSRGVPIAWIGSNMSGTAAGMASVRVRIPVATKLALPDEIASGQIMSSLFEQSLLLFADAVALAYSREKGLELPLLWRCHANLE